MTGNVYDEHFPLVVESSVPNKLEAMKYSTQTPLPEHNHNADELESLP
jgi:hypothetical protein